MFLALRDAEAARFTQNVALTSAMAVALDPVAVIVDMRCGRAECTVKRAGEALKPQKPMPLYAGDLVAVGGRGEVDVVTSDRRHVRVGIDGRSYRVGAPERTSGT